MNDSDERSPTQPRWTEAQRLAALQEYAVLDTASEADFDDLVELAAQICGTPISLISLVDESRQWFKAKKGLSVPETARAVSFCSHAIQQEGLFEVTDPSADERFASNPLVTGDPRIRFYAGQPLLTPSGVPLGTLCVIDNKSHPALSTQQQAALRILARQVMVRMELRRALAGERVTGDLLAAENQFLQDKVIEQTGELRVNQAALRQSMKMEALGQLTGGIAHDFNNLLQGIVGSATAARKLLSLNQPDRAEHFMGLVINSAQRAAGLTKRLLAFARNQPMEPETIDIQQSLRSLGEIIQRVCGEDIEVRVLEADGLWTTRCDPNQLENAVLNLSINSRDAMPDGGRLTIRFSNEHVDSNLVLQRPRALSGDFVRICVNDNGSGMTPETMARAFDAFFTTKPAGLGTGLGLSMVSGFVRQAGGFVEIESELGAGTTIKLHLPRSDPNLIKPRAAPLQAGTSDLTGHRIVVVEDDSVIRELICALLIDLGCQVFAASDGAAGLRILESAERIDLLVTDVGLPGLSGVRLSEIARATRPNVKLLLISGYGASEKMASVPATSLLSKPFSMETLVQRIREQLTPRE